jgi:hypothetical protein
MGRAENRADILLIPMMSQLLSRIVAIYSTVIGVLGGAVRI